MGEQLGLVIPLRKDPQAEQIKRVGERIERHVLTFCRLHKGQEFRMEQLTGAVLLAARMSGDGELAPDSPGRIFRALRQRGVIKYEVTNRAQSRYCVTEVRT